ncbi:MAG: hypothetical protein MHPSP_001138 [Paramarteilia canceri]
MLFQRFQRMRPFGGSRRQNLMGRSSGQSMNRRMGPHRTNNLNSRNRLRFSRPSLKSNPHSSRIGTPFRANRLRTKNTRFGMPKFGPNLSNSKKTIPSTTRPVGITRFNRPTRSNFGNRLKIMARRPSPIKIFNSNRPTASRLQTNRSKIPPIIRNRPKIGLINRRLNIRRPLSTVPIDPSNIKSLRPTGLQKFNKLTSTNKRVMGLNKSFVLPKPEIARKTSSVIRKRTPSIFLSRKKITGRIQPRIKQDLPNKFINKPSFIRRPPIQKPIMKPKLIPKFEKKLNKIPIFKATKYSPAKIPIQLFKKKPKLIIEKIPSPSTIRSKGDLATKQPKIFNNRRIPIKTVKPVLTNKIIKKITPPKKFYLKRPTTSRPVKIVDIIKKPVYIKPSKSVRVPVILDRFFPLFQVLVPKLIEKSRSVNKRPVKSDSSNQISKVLDATLKRMQNTEKFIESIIEGKQLVLDRKIDLDFSID